MSSFKATIKINNRKVNNVQEQLGDSLFLTVEALRTEIKQEQVMPFDIGTMQNEATITQKINNYHSQIRTETPYAVRLYYHPEYNFNKTKNKHAQGRWLEPWISGDKKDWCAQTFAKIEKGRGGSK